MKYTRAATFVPALSLVVILLTHQAGPAEAQGVGGGRSQRPRPAPQADARDGREVSTAALGAWLDTADVLRPGDAWLSLYVISWRAAGLRELDFPVVDVAAGVAPRVQVGASVPYYSVNAGGVTTRGIGDVYLHGKVALVEPTTGGFALAVSPALGIGSSGFDEEEGRFHWVLPVSAQITRDPLRLYGSAGYFSRGSFFTGAGVDAALTDRVGVTAAVSRAMASTERAGTDGRTLGRTDLSGGIYVAPASRLVVFGSVGRSFGSEAVEGTFVTAGVGFGIGR